MKKPTPRIIKNRIQKLLLQIMRIKHSQCVFATYQLKAGVCKGYTQAEHIIPRNNSSLYGDLRNIVLLCEYHNGFWKPQNALLYAELIQKVIGKEIYDWLVKMSYQRPTHTYGVKEWLDIEAELKEKIADLST